MVIAWGAVCLGIFGVGVSSAVTWWGAKKLWRKDSSDDQKALKKAKEIADSEATHKILGAVSKGIAEGMSKK